MSVKWEDIIERLVQFSVVSAARVTEFEIAGLRCAASLHVNFLVVFDIVGFEKL